MMYVTLKMGIHSPKVAYVVSRRGLHSLCGCSLVPETRKHLCILLARKRSAPSGGSI